jgi:hypothetical protein
MTFAAKAPGCATSRLNGPSPRMRYLLALLVLAIGALAQAADLTPIEERKIQYLIATIEALSNAQFIRNGTVYDARSAANHLRLKLKRAGTKIATAEDFIRLCASASSVSGSPYQIKFADGSVVTSAAFLQQKLLEYEQIPGTK